MSPNNIFINKYKKLVLYIVILINSTQMVGNFSSKFLILTSLDVGLLLL